MERREIAEVVQKRRLNTRITFKRLSYNRNYIEIKLLKDFLSKEKIILWYQFHLNLTFIITVIIIIIKLIVQETTVMLIDINHLLYNNKNSLKELLK